MLPFQVPIHLPWMILLSSTWKIVDSMAPTESLEAMYVATHPCWEKLKYCQNSATLLQFVLGEIHGLIQ